MSPRRTPRPCLVAATWAAWAEWTSESEPLAGLTGMDSKMLASPLREAILFAAGGDAASRAPDQADRHAAAAARCRTRHPAVRLRSRLRPGTASAVARDPARGQYPLRRQGQPIGCGAAHAGSDRGRG